MKNIRIDFGFGVGKHADGTPIDPHHELPHALQRICRKAAELFGGYTLVAGYGGWINPRGGCVEEPCRTLIVYVPNHPEGDDAWAKQEIAIWDIRKTIKATLQQEAVAVVRTLCDVEIS